MLHWVSLCNYNLPFNTKRTKLNISNNMQTLLGCTILHNIAQHEDKSRSITEYCNRSESPGEGCRSEKVVGLVAGEWASWVAWLGGKWLSRKSRRDNSYISTYIQGQKWRRSQATERNSRKTGGEEEWLQKADHVVSSFSGYIKAFMSRGLNSCY